jgi:hypothetical protein
MILFSKVFTIILSFFLDKFVYLSKNFFSPDINKVFCKLDIIYKLLFFFYT